MVGFGMLLGVAGALGQEPGTESRQVDFTLLLPAEAGKDLVATHCSSCHSLSSTVSGSRTAEEWANTVEDMILEHHAPIREKEVRIIADYLGKYAGPGNPLREFPVDLNTATQAALSRLPFVTADKARRILEYRAGKGKISNLAELADILGSDTLQKLQPYVTVKNGDRSDGRSRANE